MIIQPPVSTLNDTLSPDSTHFRSRAVLRGAAVLSDHHQRAVERQLLESVRGILFAGSLPVCAHHDTLWGVENFQSVVGSAEKHIKVEFHVSEIDLKLGSLFAPRRKDHAAIDRNPRLPEEIGGAHV